MRRFRLPAEFCRVGLRRLAASLLLAGTALAQGVTDADPDALTLSRVLESSSLHFPQVLEARAKRTEALADVLAAEGQFDLKLKQENLHWATGFYDINSVDSKLVKPVAPFGGEVAVGYRVQRGIFPVYEAIHETLDQGELNLELTFSLLRDRKIDPRRFNLSDANLKVDAAEVEVLATRFKVQQDASKAYWRWVASGRNMQVFADLLEISLERNRQLEKQVEAGDVARIVLVENQQNLLRREALVARARQSVVEAAMTLSLYLRDDLGAPAVPVEGQLPDGLPNPDDAMMQDVQADLARALSASPNLRRVDVEMQRARQREALNKNEFQPRFDVNFKFAPDLGRGKAELEQTDTILEVQVEVPIETRKQRGDLAATRAQIQQLAFQRELFEQQLRANLGQLSQALETSVELAGLAQRELEQAITLQQAEQVRFREGASDFFILNRREEQTAEARVRLAEARLRFYLAVADYQALTVDDRALVVPLEFN